MIQWIRFCYKSMIKLIVKIIMKIIQVSSLYSIEMMVAHLILGSVNYVYLFNLAKSSELLASASIYQTSSLSTVLYASPNDISFSPLGNDYSMHEQITPLKSKQAEIVIATNQKQPELLQDSLCYIESNLHTPDQFRVYNDNFCFRANNTSFYWLTCDRSYYLPDLIDKQAPQGVKFWEKKVTPSSLDKLVPLTYQQYHSEGTILWLGRIVKNIFKDAIVRMNDASRTDVVVVFIGYVLMSCTFLSLYMKMHKLGSKYTLATAVFISGFFSFMLSLATLYKLGTPINPVLLSESTPFLVATIGFDRPYKLTKRIFEEESTNQRTTLYILSRSVPCIAPTLINDGILEIIIFVLGSRINVPGLREFCMMSAFLIAYDIIFMFTWYISVLSLNLELRKIKQRTTVSSASITMSNNDPLEAESSSSAASDNCPFVYRNVKLGDKSTIQPAVPKFKLFMTREHFNSLCVIPTVGSNIDFSTSRK